VVGLGILINKMLPYSHGQILTSVTRFTTCGMTVSHADFLLMSRSLLEPLKVFAMVFVLDMRVADYGGMHGWLDILDMRV
jgi:hypothetical protein